MKLDYKIIAMMLNIEPAKVKRWIKVGKLKGIKVERNWEVEFEDLKQFVLGTNEVNIKHLDLCENRFYDSKYYLTEISSNFNTAKG